MLLTREELDESAKIHPDVAKFLEGMPPPDFSDHNAVRDGLRMMSEAVLSQLGLPPPVMTERFHKIPLRDGTPSEIKIHKPADAKPGPLMVLIFGGGFIAGDNNQLTPLARLLVLMFGATVVNINYRLGPEHPFPQGQLDAIDSVKWIAGNAADPMLAADPTKGFIIGGPSSGGSIAAALARYFEEDKLVHPLTGQWLNVPSIMDLASCPEKYKSRYISPEQNADAPMLPKAAFEVMAEQSGWDMTSDLRAAVLSKTPVEKQPKAYFQVCGMDILRDDGLIYEEILKEAGVPTKIDFYPGCPHGYALLMAATKMGIDGNIDTLIGFGWLLGQAVSREDAAKVMGLPA